MSFDVTNYYGYVFRPGTNEEKVVLIDPRAFLAQEAAKNAILNNGWNPTDVWLLEEKRGIYQIQCAPGGRDKLDMPHLRTFAVEWNKKWLENKDRKSNL